MRILSGHIIIFAANESNAPSSPKICEQGICPRNNEPCSCLSYDKNQALNKVLLTGKKSPHTLIAKVETKRKRMGWVPPKRGACMGDFGPCKEPTFGKNDGIRFCGAHMPVYTESLDGFETCAKRSKKYCKCM